MGASFTSIQVRTQSASTRDKLIAALLASADVRGMSIIEESDASSDRTVVIVPGQRWISVLDEATESQSQKELQELAALLSKAVDGPAVSVQVYDSDICELCLLDGGKLVDHYNSNPGYWGDRKLTAKQRSAAAGHPDRWADLLTEGHTVSELASSWAESPTFAEEIATKTAELLGCSPHFATVGYEYLKEEPLPEGTCVLRFRLRDRPSWDTRAEGPPRFVADMVMPPLAARYAVGDDLHHMLTCRNAGGKGKGLWALAWGDALSNKLIEIDQFVVIVGPVGDVREPQVTSPVPQVGAQELILEAAMPEQIIPAGIIGDLQSCDATNWKKVFDAMERTQVCLSIRGRVVRSGKGILGIGLYPMENPQDGTLAWAQDLIIDPPLCRPLHAGDRCSSEMLRVLAADTFLVGMVVLDAPRSQLVDLARSTFEQFAAKCPVPEKYEVVTCLSDPRKAPKTQKAKFIGFFASRKWKDLRNAMCEERQVQIATESVVRGFPLVAGEIPSLHAGGHGMMVGGDLLDPTMAGDPELPLACWWADVSNWSPAQVSDAAEGLKASIDSVMQGGMGVQAFLSRSGRPPQGLDSTAYEAACHVFGPVTMLKSWSTQWLRAIGTEALWIGPELCRRLDINIKSELETHAVVTEVGSSMRICPLSRDVVPALEQLLAAILPSLQDAQDANVTYFDRVRRSSGGPIVFC